VRVLSRVFRGKFIAGLRRAFQRNKLVFHGVCLPLTQEKAFAAFVRTLFRQDWVVYAKPPFGGPEHVLQYLACYTHRVAISNHRLLSVDDHQVRFRWKDYAHHNKRRTMTLSNEEFMRRFLQHILPRGFPRIRYFGWLANRRRRTLLPICRNRLACQPPATPSTVASEDTTWRCPCCHGPMRLDERQTALQIRRKEVTVRPLLIVRNSLPLLALALSTYRCVLTGNHSHTAPRSSPARIWYPYHPRFGQEVKVVRSFKKIGGNNVQVAFEDGSQACLPDWMLDEQACADIHQSDAPAS
jgi:hypothetical protein